MTARPLATSIMRRDLVGRCQAGIGALLAIDIRTLPKDAEHRAPAHAPIVAADMSKTPPAHPARAACDDLRLHGSLHTGAQSTEPLHAPPPYDPPEP